MSNNQKNKIPAKMIESDDIATIYQADIYTQHFLRDPAGFTIDSLTQSQMGFDKKSKRVILQVWSNWFNGMCLYEINKTATAHNLIHTVDFSVCGGGGNAPNIPTTAEIVVGLKADEEFLRVLKTLVDSAIETATSADGAGGNTAGGKGKQ